jgi:hypothetical protein
VVAAAVGIAGPVAAGAAVGRPHLGMAVALGGLALGGEGRGETFREQARGLARALLAGSAAVLAGSAVAGRGLGAALGLPALAAAAGLLGGISRPMVRATTQFILFAVIAAGAGARGGRPAASALLFALGGAFTAAVALALRPPFRALRPRPASPAPASAPQPGPTARQLLRRWWRTLAHLKAWQYPLRIGSCLLAAQALERVWPRPHGYWVSITAAIVVQRDLRTALARTIQRAAGTALGVALASLLLLGPTPAWALVALMALLAAARPVLRELSYAAYAAATTPLVLLLLDAGREPSWATLAERLAATLAGCAIALLLGHLAWSRLAR